MKQPKDSPSTKVAKIIEGRSPAGRNDLVAGWHNFLKKILSQTAPYMREGHLVTFRNVEQHERKLFEKLTQNVTVPDSVSAVYMPPSVRFQMMYHRPAQENVPQPIPEHPPDNPPDEGIVLACRMPDFNTVINVLMAKPPFTPAIDVYEDGKLLAGYVYNNIDECVGDLTKVLQTHLQ